MQQSAIPPGPGDRRVSEYSPLRNSPVRGRCLTNEYSVSVHYSLLQPHKWPDHSHSQVRIVLTLDPVEAVVSWRVRSAQERRGVAGQFVWLLPANTPHAAVWHGEAGVVVLMVEPAFVRAVCETDVAAVRLEEFSTLARFNLRVWHLAEDFRRLCRGNHRADAPLVESMGTLLAAHMLRSLVRLGEVVAPGLSPAKLRAVFDFIDVHLRETITRASLARIVHMGVRSFGRQFKLRTGLTPCDYVRRRRTTRALELLEEGCMKRSAIASEVGFYDQSHMLKQIRRLRAEETSGIHEKLHAR